jgi:uncharacterized protein (TIGR00369 family)
MTQQYLKAVRQAGQTVNPLFAFLQATLECSDQGEALIRLPVSDKLRQGGGMVAGGIMATIADEAMAHAVMMALQPGETTVTAEMNIRYLRGADPRQGGQLTARARVVKIGRSLCVAEAEVSDSSGRLLATAGATFCVLAGPATVGSTSVL